MGCVRKLFNIFVLSFAVIGFVSVGGPDFVKEKFNEMVSSDLSQKAHELGDFSELNKEFEIDKSMNLFGYKGILAEHQASGQKMIIFNSKDKILTQEDINSPNLEEKLMSLIKKQRRNSIVPSNFEITDKGTMKAYGKKVPYAKFSAKVKKLPIANMEGIISVAEFDDEDNRILLSINQDGKYSQLVSQEFFQSIKR